VEGRFQDDGRAVSGLEEHLRSHHGYDVPEILCTPVTAGNLAYLEWLSAETQPRQS
jgi:periplasmic divalent cation tolerance protein